jgi:hypothetical protein
MLLYDNSRRYVLYDEFHTRSSISWADQSIFIFGLDFKRVVYSAGPSGFTINHVKFTCIIMGFSLRQVNIKWFQINHAISCSRSVFS